MKDEVTPLGTGRRRVLALALVAVSVLTAACSGKSDAQTVVPRCIGTGSQSTVSYRFGKALAEVLRSTIPDTDWELRPRAAARANLDMVASESCDLAIVAGDAAASRTEGSGRTSPPLPLRALARVYDSTVQLVVPEDSKITKVADLEAPGITVATGPRDSCTQFIAFRMMAAARVPNSVGIAQLDIPEALNAMREGRVQAVFWSSEVPSSNIESYSEQVSRIRLVNTDDLLPALQTRFGKTGLMYGPATVPAKTYALEKTVQTVAVPNYVVVNASMGDDLAYKITQQLFEQQDRLARAVPDAADFDLQTAISTQPVNLHNGAIRFYRDRKP